MVLSYSSVRIHPSCFLVDSHRKEGKKAEGGVSLSPGYQPAPRTGRAGLLTSGCTDLYRTRLSHQGYQALREVEDGRQGEGVRAFGNWRRMWGMSGR
jgi:hypothetical protein